MPARASANGLKCTRIHLSTQNGGLCAISPTGAVGCVCPDGWEGVSCETRSLRCSKDDPIAAGLTGLSVITVGTIVCPTTQNVYEYVWGTRGRTCFAM
jgi:hypothetical protein